MNVFILRWFITDVLYRVRHLKTASFLGRVPYVYNRSRIQMCQQITLDYSVFTFRPPKTFERTWLNLAVGEIVKV